MSENKELLEFRQKLKEEQSKIQKEQTKALREKKKADKLKTEITDFFDKSFQEIDQAVDAYGKENQKNTDEKVEIQKRYENLKVIPRAIEDETKTKIDTAIIEIENQITQWKNRITELEGPGNNSILDAETKYKIAELNLKSKQENYDIIKSLQKQIKDSLQKLKDLEKSIETEEATGENFQNENIYFLIWDLGKNLEKINIKPKDELKEDLNEALLGLAEAKKAWINAEDKLNERKDEREELKKNLEEAEKKRTEKFLEKIHLDLLK